MKESNFKNMSSRIIQGFQITVSVLCSDSMVELRFIIFKQFCLKFLTFMMFYLK